jgi:hypothetical protein
VGTNILEIAAIKHHTKIVATILAHLEKKKQMDSFVKNVNSLG